MLSENTNEPEIINLELVRSICTVPTKYTVNGTSMEAAYYISGICDIICKVDLELVHTFDQFLHWLPVKLKYPPNLVWLAAFRHRCKADDEAFYQLISLYQEYTVSEPKIETDKRDYSSIMGNKMVALVAYMCHRPECFAINDVFTEATAYLDGCVWGLSRINSDSVYVWDGFEEWLSSKLDYPLEHHWAREVQLKYPQYKAAFSQLHSLFREYLDSVDPRDNDWQNQYDRLMQSLRAT